MGYGTEVTPVRGGVWHLGCCPVRHGYGTEDTVLLDLGHGTEVILLSGVEYST